jgi:hypothetical protein
MTFETFWVARQVSKLLVLQDLSDRFVSLLIRHPKCVYRFPNRWESQTHGSKRFSDRVDMMLQIVINSVYLVLKFSQWRGWPLSYEIQTTLISL